MGNLVTSVMFVIIHLESLSSVSLPLSTRTRLLLSCAMLLRYDFGLVAEADAIEAAVEKVLDAGWRTGDIAGNGADLEAVKAAGKLVGTKKMGDLVLEAL